MLCQHCHQEIPDDFTICPYCGLSQVNPDYAKAQIRKINKTYSWFVTFGLLLILLMGTLYLKSNDYLIDEMIDHFKFSLHEDEYIEQLDEALINHQYIKYQSIMDSMNYSYHEQLSNYYNYSNLLRAFISIQDNLSAILENREVDYRDHYLELARSLTDFNENVTFIMRHADPHQVSTIDMIVDDLRYYLMNVLQCSNEQVNQLLSSDNSSQLIQLINNLLNEGDVYE